MKKFIATACLLFTSATFAEVAVIVHPSNASALDKNTITRIFLGKSKSFPNGDQAVPVNQKDSAAQTSEFNSKVLNKSSSQLKAYWSKLVFTGKGTPPKDLDSNEDVIKLVSTNPNLIGYVDAASVTDGVKVVGTF